MLSSVRTLPQTPLYYTGYQRYRLYVTVYADTTTNSVILYWLSLVKIICYCLCGHYHKLRYTILAIVSEDYMLPSVRTLPQTPLYYTGYQSVQTICYHLCVHYHKICYTILAISGTDYMLPSVQTLPQTPLYNTGYQWYRLYVTVCADTTTNSVILYWLSSVQIICYHLCGHYHKLCYTILAINRYRLYVTISADTTTNTVILYWLSLVKIICYRLCVHYHKLRYTILAINRYRLYVTISVDTTTNSVILYWLSLVKIICYHLCVHYHKLRYTILAINRYRLYVTICAYTTTKSVILYWLSAVQTICYRLCGHYHKLRYTILAIIGTDYMLPSVRTLPQNLLYYTGYQRYRLYVTVCADTTTNSVIQYWLSVVQTICYRLCGHYHKLRYTILAIIGTDYMLPSVRTLPQTLLYYTGYQSVQTICYHQCGHYHKHRYTILAIISEDYMLSPVRTLPQTPLYYTGYQSVQTICYHQCGHYHKLCYTILAIISEDYMLSPVRTLPQTPLYYTGYHRYRIYVTVYADTITNSVIQYWLSAVQTICYSLCGHYHKLRYTILAIIGTEYMLQSMRTLP